MNKLEGRILTISLFLFLTLVIMNSVKFIGVVASIGRVGKLLFALFFIAGVFVLTDIRKMKMKLLVLPECIVIIALLMLFAGYFIISTQTQINLAANLAFPIYFVFYYFIIRLLIQINRSKYGTEVINATKLKVVSIFRKTLFINFIVWFIVAFALGINMFEIDGGFGGFFQDEIHFGFYVVTGFLVSLYLRYNEISKDKSLYNLLLIIMYGGIAIFTSRNAFLIIVVALLYYFLVSKVKNRFYRVSLFTLIFIGVNFSIVLQELSEKDVVQLTSGRYNIWLFALEEMVYNGLFLMGYGLFNLNDVVLRSHQGIGFYYLDSLSAMSFHNSYVEILAGGGLVVLILFFRIISKTWKRLSRVERSIVTCVLVGATFESFLVQPFMLLSSFFYLLLISNNLIIKIRGEQLIENNSILEASETPQPILER